MPGGAPDGPAPRAGRTLLALSYDTPTVVPGVVAPLASLCRGGAHRFSRRRALFRAFLPAVFSWGLVTGVAMSKSALTVPEAIGMSLLVYAGSAQLAVLPLFAAGLPIWTIWLTAAVVNLRFVIFSAALQPHFSYLPLGRRTVLGFFNGDLHFVYFMQKYVEPGYAPGKEGYFWGWRWSTAPPGRFRRCSASCWPACSRTPGGSGSPA